MSNNNFLNFEGLTTFFNNLINKFALKIHKHTLSDITDYTVDTELSSTSTNPVANKTVNTGFSIVGNSISSLQTAVSGKADTNHNHDDKYYTESEIDTKLSNKSDKTHNHDTAYDAKGAAEDALAESKEYTDTVASGKSNTGHTHSIANVTNLQTTLDGKVPTSRTVNGKALTANITLSASDVGADASGTAETKANAVQTNLDALSDEVADHVDNADIHFTAAERTKLSGIATGANKYSHPNSGVTAGTYKSVTVNAQGHVTAGSNPTTLAGYGITDAEAKGTATSTVGAHNTSTSAHSDIRDLITGLTTRLNALADSDDTTLDQMSEIVAYIKANKTLIESITTSKINVSDIVNNLTTNSSSKVLSAAQGVAIKSLIDALDSELGSHTHDGRYYTESEIDTKLSGKANSSHGNHVPATETANNAKFLRNDNTWQTVTPANIGAAASSHGTHVSYSTTAPVMDGTASVGTASTVSRSDHKHPTDTSRASQSSLDSHTGNTTSHITSTERTNWNAAKTHADSAHAPSNAEKNQNAFSNIKVGDTTIAADTTTDTLTLVGSNVTITPDATNDKVTIAVADGTTSAKGIVKLTNSTSSTSTTTAATPNSVKSAYDLANTAKTNAANAQSKADSAYSLAESKVDSLSDLGITATATELNYVDGVTSNVQTQLDNLNSSLNNKMKTYGYLSNVDLFEWALSQTVSSTFGVIPDTVTNIPAHTYLRGLLIVHNNDRGIILFAGTHLWTATTSGGSFEYSTWQDFDINHEHDYLPLNGNANSATHPLGFNSRLDSSDWGNTLGTHVTGWDIDGCAVAFRRDNPSEGKLSMKIDGYIYQNEGTYRCLDTSNFSYSNGTLTITT